MNACIYLKKGKDKPIRNFHHWIFSGALHQKAECPDGDIVKVLTFEGELLGHAFVNSRSSIYGRMVSFGSVNPYDAIKNNILSAINMRSTFMNHDTNAYRLINGEADYLPGLVVDKYDDVCVVQIGTLGMEKLKELICTVLVERTKARSVIEHSLVASRKDEGLLPVHSVLYGENISQVTIRENGLTFNVDLFNGHKTGFYLDHRAMRELVKSLSKDRRVLNLFSYTGAFSIYALSGGAAHAQSVDISEAALTFVEEHCACNAICPEKHTKVCCDVFDFVRTETIDSDFVIIDPPAFAKHKKDVMKACRGYKDINRIVIGKVPSGSLVLTCSCSYFIDHSLFEKVIFQASSEAKRRVRILQRHHLGFDHCINVFHPESDYLKSLLLYVE